MKNKQQSPVLDRLPDKGRVKPKQFSITLRRNQRVETTQPQNSFKKVDGRPPLLAAVIWKVPPLAANLHRLDKIVQVVLRDPMRSFFTRRRSFIRRLCAFGFGPLTPHCTSRTQEAEPVDDVVPVHHSFIFELLSTEGPSLLLRKGAILDLDLALDVVNCVRRLHIQRDRVASQRFHTLLNVDRRSATMVCVKVCTMYGG